MFGVYVRMYLRTYIRMYVVTDHIITATTYVCSPYFDWDEKCIW